MRMGVSNNVIIDVYKCIFGGGSFLFSSAVSIAMIVVGKIAKYRCINKYK